MKKKQESTDRNYFGMHDNLTQDTIKSTDFIPEGVWEASVGKRETITVEEDLKKEKVLGEYNKIYTENIDSDSSEKRN